MPAGRARLVFRRNWSIPGLYQFDQGRRAGLWEGSFAGNIGHIDRDRMSGEMELICVGGPTLIISVTLLTANLLCAVRRKGPWVSSLSRSNGLAGGMITRLREIDRLTP